MQGGSACENAPGLRHGASNVEFAAMAAPRPMILVSTSVDQTRNTPKRRVSPLFAGSTTYSDTATTLNTPRSTRRTTTTASAGKRFTGSSPNTYSAMERTSTPQSRRFSSDEVCRISWSCTTGPGLQTRSVTTGSFVNGEKPRSPQMNSIRDKGVLREYLRQALTVEWPEQVTLETNGDEIVLSRRA